MEILGNHTHIIVQSEKLDYFCPDFSVPIKRNYSFIIFIETY